MADSSRPRSTTRRLPGRRAIAASASVTASLRPTSSWRTVPTISAPRRRRPARKPSSSSDASSAHWRSSSRTTTGWSRPACSSSSANASNRWNWAACAWPGSIATSPVSSSTRAGGISTPCSASSRSGASHGHRAGAAPPSSLRPQTAIEPARRRQRRAGAALGEAGLADAGLALDDDELGVAAGSAKASSRVASSDVRPLRSVVATAGRSGPWRLGLGPAWVPRWARSARGPAVTPGGPGPDRGRGSPTRGRAGRGRARCRAPRERGGGVGQAAQRLGLAARAVEGEPRAGLGGAPAAGSGRRAPAARDDRRLVAEREVGVEPILDHGEPSLLEAGRGIGRELDVGELHERWSSPERLGLDESGVGSRASPASSAARPSSASRPKRRWSTSAGSTRRR